MIRSLLVKVTAPFLLPISLFLLAACSEPQSGSPANFVEAPGDVGSRRFVVVSPLWACPKASDFHEKIDGLIKGDMSVPLPERCRRLEEGTVVIQQPGLRPSIQYRGFDIEQATLGGGQVFWSDELNGDTLRQTAAVRIPAQRSLL